MIHHSEGEFLSKCGGRIMTENAQFSDSCGDVKTNGIEGKGCFCRSGFIGS